MIVEKSKKLGMPTEDKEEYRKDKGEYRKDKEKYQMNKDNNCMTDNNKDECSEREKPA
jgi:hypothetical protein